VSGLVKVLVVYDSKTGNTEKMAKAIADGVESVKGTKVFVKKVEDVSLNDLVRADGVVLGSPVYYGQMSAGLKSLVDKSVKVHGKLEGKVGAAFTSSGGKASGAETTLISILEALLVHGMIVQGRSSRRHYGSACVGAPKTQDIRECKELGKRVATLCMKLKE
jgi:NAD(P)H dehydrogenase (quinone)